MPSLIHDALVQLFRNRPSLAPDLLRDALQAPVPAFDHVRIGDAALGEIAPTEYRADLVLLLEAESPKGTPPRAALVLEAQLGRDADKRWSWPVYLAGLRARLRCDVVLLVVTNDAGIATWAATPIHTGHPGWVLLPLVLGPAAVPLVVEERDAVEAPELAVLSAMVHGDDPRAAQVGKAAIAGARRLDDERAMLYVDLVFTSLRGAARAVLEALMANGNYEYQSDFAKRYVAQGRAEGRAEGRTEGRTEGRAEGRTEGRAESILRVLEARGIAVGAEQRARILSCTDMPTLDAWLARAVSAASADEVIGQG